jgi:hypothetical protein
MPLKPFYPVVDSDGPRIYPDVTSCRPDDPLGGLGATGSRVAEGPIAGRQTPMRGGGSPCRPREGWNNLIPTAIAAGRPCLHSGLQR